MNTEHRGKHAAAAAIDLSQLVAAVGDAIVVTDASGAITLWNPAAERMFGFPASEALGRPLDLIIPERLRNRHWEGFHKTMLTGQTKYGTDLLRVPGLASCASCGALIASDARFCSSCGAATAS